MSCLDVSLDSKDHAPQVLHLLHLPQNLLELIMRCMLPTELSCFSTVAPAFAALSESKRLWQGFLDQIFPEITEATLSIRASRPGLEPKQRFFELAFRRKGARCPFVHGCGGSLILTNLRRCPCVATRTNLLPLRLGSLVSRRSGTSALSGGGFNNMLVALARYFAFEHIEMDTLQEDTLAPLDILLLCTMEGPPLGADELRALRSWVEGGGSLITSAFSNWSAWNHFAANTVGWLGLETIPHADFDGLREHELINLRSQGSDTDRTYQLLAGPFGQPAHFINMGESNFRVLPDAMQFGAVGLASKLVFYPPRLLSHGGVTGKGRVLVCSNFHWLADPNHWNGGLFNCRPREVAKHEAERPNQALLLNFVAGAVAARTDR